MKTTAPWTCFNYHGRAVCYGREPDGLQARELGREALIEMTPELRSAIEADELYHMAKDRGIE